MGSSSICSLVLRQETESWCEKNYDRKAGEPNSSQTKRWLTTKSNQEIKSAIDAVGARFYFKLMRSESIFSHIRVTSSLLDSTCRCIHSAKLCNTVCCSIGLLQQAEGPGTHASKNGIRSMQAPRSTSCTRPA